MSELRKALESLRASMVFDPRDWGRVKRDAWMYAILIGWDDDDRPSQVMDAVAARHGWSAETVARLRRMRAAVKAAVDEDGRG